MGEKNTGKEIRVSKSDVQEKGAGAQKQLSDNSREIPMANDEPTLAPEVSRAAWDSPQGRTGYSVVAFLRAL